MTISRGQMKRQLYEGGGIMSLSKEGIGGGSIKGVDMGSRIGFFNPFKSAKKVVKKATKAVKKIASSDLGKAALLYAGTAGLGALGAGSAARATTGFGGIFNPGNVFKNLAASGANIAGFFKPTEFATADMDILKGPSRATSLLKKTFDTVKGTGNIGKLATLGAVSTFLTQSLGMTPEQAEEELARDPSTYLEQYYRNLNPPTADTTSEQYEQQVRDFVTANTSEYAVGGRVGFAEGTYKDFEEFMMRRSESMSERQKEELRKQFEMYMRSKDPTVEAAEGGRIGFADGPVLPPDPTQPVNPFGPKPPADAPVLPDRMMASNIENDKILEALFEKYIDMGLSPKEAAERAKEEFDRMSNMRIEETRGLAAIGGKMDNASDNAMQAAGIEGLPIRQNPKGVKELDLRETGGFIQPVGIKEKEDDIPAMLSNNEFVMTADAVRGMGGGNVELGAQRMYDQMKMLEAGGKV